MKNFGLLLLVGLLIPALVAPRTQGVGLVGPADECENVMLRFYAHASGTGEFTKNGFKEYQPNGGPYVGWYFNEDQQVNWDGSSHTVPVNYTTSEISEGNTRDPGLVTTTTTTSGSLLHQANKSPYGVLVWENFTGQKLITSGVDDQRAVHSYMVTPAYSWVSENLTDHQDLRPSKIDNVWKLSGTKTSSGTIYTYHNAGLTPQDNSAYQIPETSQSIFGDLSVFNPFQATITGSTQKFSSNDGETRTAFLHEPFTDQILIGYASDAATYSSGFIRMKNNAFSGASTLFNSTHEHVTVSKAEFYFELEGEKDVSYIITWKEIINNDGTISKKDRKITVTGKGKGQIVTTETQKLDPPQENGSKSILGVTVHRVGSDGFCSTCGKGSAEMSTGCASYSIDMGLSVNGTSAGELYFSQDKADSTLSTPLNLRFSKDSSGNEEQLGISAFQAYQNAHGADSITYSTYPGTGDAEAVVVKVGPYISQVWTLDKFAQITVINGHQYTVGLFLSSQVTRQGRGDYRLNIGAIPLAVWTIENPDLSSFNKLKITKSTYGDTLQDFRTTESLFQHVGPSTWSLQRGDEVESESFNNYQNQFGNTLNETVASGNTEFGAAKGVNREYNVWPNGNVLMSETTGEDQWTHYTYNPDGSLNNIQRADGYWESYVYSSDGLFLLKKYTSLESPITYFIDQAVEEMRYSYAGVAGYQTVGGDDVLISPSSPRLIQHFYQGVEIGRTWNIFKHNQFIEIRGATADSAWNDVNNVKTVYDYTDDSHLSKLTHPDGTYETYSTTLLNFQFTDTVTSYSSANAGITELRTVKDYLGRSLLVQAKDLVTGVIVSQITYTRDSRGRTKTETYLDGSKTYYDYACCGVSRIVNPDQTLVEFQYDDLNRVSVKTVNGVSLSYRYDGAGRVRIVKRIGRDGSEQIICQYSFDTAGRMTYSNDGGVISTITYGMDYDVLGRDLHYRKTAISTPAPSGTVWRKEYFRRSGEMVKLDGELTHPVQFLHGVDTEGKYVAETKLTRTGGGTPEFVKRSTDFLGRPYRTARAGNAIVPSGISQKYYNAADQLYKEVDPDGVITLFLYNDKGQLSHTATLDNAASSPVLDDLVQTGSRINSIVTDVAASHGTWVNRSQIFSYTNGVATPLLMKTDESSIDGLKRWVTMGQAVTLYEKTLADVNGVSSLTVTAPDNTIRRFRYVKGQLESITDLSSTSVQLAKKSFVYDVYDRQTGITDARNGQTTSEFDINDRLVSITTPLPGDGSLAQKTIFEYDSLSRQRLITAPDGTTQTLEYYPSGELKSKTGGRDYPVSYEYDGQGRMTSMKTWGQYGVESTARTTTWQYNGYRGWLDQKTYPDGKALSYTYLPSGRLQTRTSGRNIVSSYTYNFAGEVSNVTYSDGTPSVAYNYDRMGRLATVANANGTITKYHNFIGQETGEVYSGGVLDGLSVTNELDSIFRTQRIALNGFNDTAGIYNYGTDGRLFSVANMSASVEYGYLANSGLIESVTSKFGPATRISSTRTYDFINRLKSITSTPTVGYTYQYNAANQRSRATQADGSYWGYLYDDLGQLKDGKRHFSDDSLVPTAQYEYVFDDIGNRKTTKIGGDESGSNLRSATYTPNNLNQYINRTVPGYLEISGNANSNSTVQVNGTTAARKGTFYRKEVAVDNSSGSQYPTVSVQGVLQNGPNPDILTIVTGQVFVPPATETFVYDDDGNLVQDGRWSYVWDAENRLTSMTSLAGTPAGSWLKLTFVYDPFGRRIQKTVQKAVVYGTWIPYSDEKFVYHGWNLLAVMNSGLTAVQKNFVWGLDASGSLQGAGGVGGLAMMTVQSAMQMFPTFDGNGNITALYNTFNSTTSVAEYEYGPFGEPWRASGPMALQNPFRYSTKYTDDETDSLYYGYRYYNPGTGKWLSRDRIQELGGHNLYGLVGNQPLSRVDINGDSWLSDALSHNYTDDEATEMKGALLGAAADSVKNLVGSVNDTIEAPARLTQRGIDLANKLSTQEGRDEVTDKLRKFAEITDRLRNDPCLLRVLVKVLGDRASEFMNDDEKLGKLLIDLGVGTLTGAGIGAVNAEIQGATTLEELATALREVESAVEAKSGLTDAEKVLYDRVTHRRGVRDQVWDAASKNGTREVYDPTGRVIQKSDDWQMGHLPEHKLSDAQLRAAEERWTRQQWIEYQNDPAIYRPEFPITNQGHAFEDPLERW